jgi:23S rRNA A1618 N6-methylase RlmF
MQWGTGSDVPRERMGTITVEEMNKAGVTSEMSQNWANFYRNEMVRNPANPSAPGRADLMQYVRDLLRSSGK